MATAGGAKMEPASWLKQSRSRKALRCLRSVPRAERHSAEEGGRSGTSGAWPRDVRGRGLCGSSRPALPDGPGTSPLPGPKGT